MSERAWRIAAFAVVAGDVGVYVAVHGRVPYLAEYPIRMAVPLAGMGVLRAIGPGVGGVLLGPGTGRAKELRTFVLFALGAGVAAVLLAAVTSAFLAATGRQIAVGPEDVRPGAAVGSWILSACLFAPIQEEVVYRGFLLGPLRGRASALWIVFLSGLTFSLLHLAYGRPEVAAAWYFAAGCLFAAAYLKSGHLWVPMALHVAGNLCVGAKDLVLIHNPGWVDWIPGIRVVVAP